MPARTGHVSITTRPQHDYERVVEFSARVEQPPCAEHKTPKATCIDCHKSPRTELAGGLIAFMVTRDGKLKVDLYNLDPNVIVQAPPEHLHRLYVPTADENVSDGVALDRAASRLERTLIEEYGGLSMEDRQAINTIRHIAGTERNDRVFAERVRTIPN